MKADRIDSIVLTNFLRGGWAAGTWHRRRPWSRTELVGFRTNLVRERTKLKNRIHAYLLTNNVSINARPLTRGFVEEVRRLDDARVQSYLRLIDAVNSEVLEA